MAANPTRISEAGAGGVSDPFGKVYTPRQLAELWQLSENSIRRLFQDEPGVFVLGDSNPRGKRGYCSPDGNEIDFNRVYDEYIRPALELAGLEPFRADEEIRAGQIIADMLQELLMADGLRSPNHRSFVEIPAEIGRLRTLCETLIA